MRPDHRDRAEPFPYTSPKGEALIIFDGTVRGANPNVPLGNRPHVQLNLGGAEGLRAVAYIVLTFFAHHFRDHARHDGLDALKDFVQSRGDNVFAWWERPETAALLPANPFAFGHTILLMTSAETQTATALVSFFGGLNFGVQLGTLSGLADASVVVFIDPQAERPPHDIQEQKSDAVLLPLPRPNPMHAHLERNIREGTAQCALQDLLHRIERWTFERDMEPVRARLNAPRDLLTPQALMREITTVIEEQTNCVYRLIRYVGDTFIATQQHNAIVQPVVRRVEAIMARDPTDPTRLNFCRGGLRGALHARPCQGAWPAVSATRPYNGRLVGCFNFRSRSRDSR